MATIIPTTYKPLWWWTQTNEPPYRYYCYSGGRASGKSTAVAQSLVCRAITQPITVLCAREYQNSIRDSVHKLLAETIEAMNLPGYTITRDAITHSNGSQFIFRGLHSNLQSVKSMEGIHVCWVEEAQTITRESLDVLIPTIREPGSTLIFTWNPLTVTDPVMQYFVTHATDERKTQTYYKHTTWRDIRDLLNASITGMIEADRNSAEYAHVWEGEPYSTTTNQIITPTDLYKTLDTPPEDGPVSIGVDVARYGTDRTAMTIKRGNTIERIEAWRHLSLTASADIITRTIQDTQAEMIRIDDTGVGGGLTDILTQRHGHKIQGINFAGKPKRPDTYPNIASELWFDFATQLPQLHFARDMEHWPELVEELTTRTWKINSRNQRQVESKQDWKDRSTLGSPDLADSLLLACYQPPQLPSWNVQI